MTSIADAEINARPETDDALSKPRRRVVRLAASVVIVAAITLALLEAALRMLGVAQPILYQSDEAAGYRLQPNQHVSYLGNEIVINSWGVRDARPLSSRPADKKRILVLGDSVTWGGIRLHQHELFTTIAEKRLGNVEIINAGVNGYSLAQMVALYQHQLRELQPDYIVFFLIPRDLTRPAISRLTGYGVAFPQNPPNSALWEAVKIARQALQDQFQWRWLRAPRSTVSERSSNSNPNDNVNALAALMKETDTPVAVVMAPRRGDTDNRTFIQDNKRPIISTGVEFADMRTRVDVNADDFVDAVHLSKSGHEKVGASFAAFLHDFVATPLPAE